MSDPFPERVVHFGPGGALLGIFTRPAAPRPDAPAVLFINSGLIHRVGPNRLYVTIARRLAELGFSSLRFDLSGIGDSAIAGGDLSVAEQAQADIRSAMDVVGGESGIVRYVVMGLCSGALAAHTAAVSDERIVGCIQLDGYVYPTWGYHLRHYGPRLVQPGTWIRLLKRALSGTPRPDGQVDNEPALGPESNAPFAAEMAPKEVFAAELRVLVERRTCLLFVLTSGGPQPVNYSRQLHDSVPSVDLDRSATVRFFPEADHTFTFAPPRRRLVDEIADWMDHCFDRGPPRPRS